VAVGRAHTAGNRAAAPAAAPLVTRVADGMRRLEASAAA
jgi:hypothetical protein